MKRRGNNHQPRGRQPVLRDRSAGNPESTPARAADDWHRTLLDRAACILLVLDPDSRVIFCNDKASVVTGYAEKDLLGMSLADLVWGDAAGGPSPTDLIKAVLVSRQETWLELPLRNRSGDPLLTSFGLAPVPAPGNGGEAVLCIGTDITQIRRGVEDLRRSERHARDAFRLLAAFSRISGRILQEMDLDQVCMLFTEAIREHSVFSRAILTLMDDNGKGYLWYFNGLTDEEIEEFHRKKLTDRQRSAIFQDRFRMGNSFYIRHDSGWSYEGVRSKVLPEHRVNWHPDDFLFIPLYGSNGRLIGMVSVDDPEDGKVPAPENLSPLELFANQVAHCIEKTHLDRKIQESRKKLVVAQEQLVQAEKLSAIGELVSGVAHELNNPLTGVMGYAELLLGSDCSPETKRSLERIHREATRCQKIVQNLLMFARRRKAERRAHSINEILESTLELREYQLRVDNIRVIKNLDDNLPKTMVDFFQLQQVFLNIINNAHQAMVESTGSGTLVVTSGRAGDRIRVDIRDSGPGIPRDHLGRIFDPFFTTKDVGKGTGLGLSLSYGIVQEHEGRIFATSVSGEGTTITVEVPIREVEQTVEKEPEAVAPDNGTSGRFILVVDDEEVIVELLQEILTNAGHRVDVARNGMEALHKIRSGSYDLILSDLKMPGMGGEELYAQIGKEKPEMLAKIVFSTGDMVSPNVQKFLKQTGNRYIPKPFRLDDILRVVGEIAGN